MASSDTEQGSGLASACSEYDHAAECPLDCWWCDDSAMCVSDWQVCAGPTGGGGWVSTAVSVCALLLIIGVPLFLCVRGIRGQLETLPPPRGEIEHAADDCLPSPYYQSGCAQSTPIVP